MEIQYISFVAGVAGLSFLLVSVCCFLFGWQKTSLYLLLSSLMLLLTAAINLDPFLNVWDERFHALVAKNLLSHPLKPTLYDNPIVPMAYDRWDRYYIWLHKEPLFLWQIALSFKIFGINEFAVRIPSAVLAFFTGMAIFRSGVIIGNFRVGYIGLFLFVTTGFIYRLVSGRLTLEHNDIAFMGYVSLSYWSFLEYTNRRSSKWIILIGLFAGLGVLCKWLVGLSVYLMWFIYILKTDGAKIRNAVPKLKAFGISTILISTWLLYAFIHYPAELARSMKHHSDHLFIAVDGHTGTWTYHFERIYELFNLSWGLVVLSIVCAFYFMKNNNVFWPLLAVIISVYLLFTVAETKMPAFTIILILPIYLLLSVTLDKLISLWDGGRQKVVATIVGFGMLTLVFSRLDISAVLKDYAINSEGNYYSWSLMHNRKIFKDLRLTNNTVLFNVKGRHYIEAMFYTDKPAYNFIPSEEQVQKVIAEGHSIAIFVNPGDTLPEYIMKANPVMLENNLFLCE
ncbi:MAG: glycosyltransferase family 39 protein [Bacteroidia bacterium]|nr:glycosyltransferase family 39 protein [Bacteroidia bacterium]